MIYRFSSEEKKGLYLLESEQVEAIRKCEKVFTKYGDKSPEAEEAFKILKNEIIELERKFNVEWERLENVRFEKLKTPRSILDDAKQQAKDSIYYTYVRLWTASEKDLPRSEAKEDRMIIDMAKGELKVHLGSWDFENIIENFKELYAPEDSPLLLDATGMQIYIERDIIKRHFDALRGLPEEKELQDAITEIIEESPYTIAEISDKKDIITSDSAISKANMPMYHGKAIDTFIMLDNKGIKINPIADKAELSTPSGDFKVIMQGFSNLKSKVGINAHKLLCTCVAEFTQNNGDGKINSTVYIPFEEYARKINPKIDNKETRKNVRKSIQKDLNLLYNLSCTWTEKIKGKEESFQSVHPVEAVGITSSGYIKLQFGQIMSEYLKSLPITQYSQGLLSIDAKNPNAYNIGFKITEHFNMDNNQIKGTANRLKVSSLLEVTNLPTYEKLKNEKVDDSRHWDRRIKEPFEAALDKLTGVVITNWEYVKAKGLPLTDKEAYSIADYETFINLYVQYELLDAPDHSDRLNRRAAEKEAAKKEADKTKPKKKKK